MTELEVRLMLTAAVTKAGGQRAFARKHDLTPGYVGDVINDRRKPGPLILEALGLESEGATTTYKRTRKI